MRMTLRIHLLAQEADSQAAFSVMTPEKDRQLGSLTVFNKADFEEDWVKVASGGFGHVYQVKHKKWRTVYALKCSPYLLQDSSMERTSMNCLMEEATKMEKIKFQHIVTIYGVCKSPLGIVMEYMARGSLEKILPTHKMSWQLKFRVIHEMGLAMNFLHSMTPPLLHLDLKPGNILLDGNMHVKISDFGLSKWMEQSSRMQYIESSALRGTLSYIPPEMFLQNSKPPGIKYDVYRRRKDFNFTFSLWPKRFAALLHKLHIHVLEIHQLLSHYSTLQPKTRNKGGFVWTHELALVKSSNTQCGTVEKKAPGA